MNATHPDRPAPSLAPPASERLVAARLRRTVRGAELDAVWARPALLTLLVGTALLYLWQLGDSGWGNDYYAAAAQAGSMDWKALLFGSLDPSNAITVDKPPASTWLMGLSVRAFGLSSWSVLVPQALCGVASVAVLHATVRRVSSTGAGLAAGLLLALTPVATLMFRFDNPDALLVLLLVGGAYAVTRALETAGTAWLVLAGSLVGAAFLTKMLQAFLVLPAFALVYLVAAPTPLRRRVLQTLAGGAAVVVSAGWWVVLVELWPEVSRPYIGGSENDSVLDLILGYNGLSRITGGEGPGGGPGGGGGFSGEAGPLRLFNDLMGGEISWLLPAAAIALVGGLWLLRGVPRTDRTRAALLMWGGWLLASGAVFSWMSGIVHPYYTVALAPAIAALVAIGGRELWRLRGDLRARLLLTGGVAATGAWSWALLDRTPDWHPEVRWAVAAASVVAVAGLLVPRVTERARAGVAIVAIAAAVALLGGPAAYSAATAATPHTGSTPASGPEGVGGLGGGPGGAGFRGGAPGMNRSNGAMPLEAGDGSRPGAGAQPAAGAAPPDGTAQGAGGMAGGPGGGAPSNAELAALLEQDSGLHTWAAATTGANSAAGLQLASGQAVMAIGGFSGSDPSPTLAEFQALVADGEIRWFIGGGGGGRGGPGGGGTGSEISTWVAATFSSTTVGGTTVYDLTQPVAAAATSGTADDGTV